MSSKEIAIVVLTLAVVILLFAAGGIQAMKGFAKTFNGSKHFISIYSWAQGLAIVLAVILVNVILYIR